MASVSVFVGKEKCLYLSAEDTTITCEAPLSAPDGTDSTGKAPVQVRKCLGLSYIVVRYNGII